MIPKSFNISMLLLPCRVREESEFVINETSIKYILIMRLKNKYTKTNRYKYLFTICGQSQYLVSDYF